MGTSFFWVPLYRSDQGKESSEAVEENFLCGPLQDWTWPLPDIDTGATDRYGNIHVPLGKVSFSEEQLDTNFRAVLDELQRAKPASAKGRYLRKMTVSSTQGPGVKIDTQRLRPELA